jgi:hypothetical protein
MLRPQMSGPKKYLALRKKLDEFAALSGETTTDLRKLKLYMAMRFSKSPTCPACSKRTWEFAGVVNLQPAAWEEQVQNHVIQLAVIVCRSCLNTMQFAWNPIDKGEVPPNWEGLFAEDEDDL